MVPTLEAHPMTLPASPRSYYYYIIYKNVLTHNVVHIQQETVSDIFDRLGGGELVNEVAMNELLLDPVTVDCLDSLTSYTLTVSHTHTHNTSLYHHTHHLLL